MLSVFAAMALVMAPGPADIDRAQAALSALALSGARDPSGQPLFPPDLEVESAALVDGAVELVLARPLPESDFDAEVVTELRREALLGALSAFEVQGGVQLLAPRDGSLVPALAGPPDVALPAEDRWPEAPRPRGAIPKEERVTEALPFGGALVGRRIAISAGHGWLANGGGWATQRARWDFAGCSSCRGITEDFFTAELVTHYIIPLLQQMGAEVVLVREPDLSSAPETVVDDGDGAYSEEGTWAEGVSPGGLGGDYRTNAPDDLGAATFSFAGLEGGHHRLSIRWPEGGNRTPAAIVSVEHAGGVRTLNLDQRLMGRHWLDLGSYWLPPGGGSVTLAHGPADGYLIADAVKVGGGMWTPADKPFWQMGAKTYAPWAGGPDSLDALGDVTIRPAYAEFVGADAYLSFHANASGIGGGSSANGLSTYRYSCGVYADHTSSPGATNCDDPPGSRDLLDEVHSGALARIRSDFDATFGDRGKLVANFGELRVLDDIPGALIETAFFDNLVPVAGRRMSDNQALHDPRWREAFAYGVVGGLARFLTPGSGPPPPRPEGLAAVNGADATVIVSWGATEGADGYRLYTSSDGRAFDEGAVIESGTSAAIEGLAPGAVYAFRVAALNANGEGFPSEVVAARFRGTVPEGQAPAGALLVYAYDRRDAWVQEQDNDLAYAVEHGAALGAIGGLYFDGALDERVADDSVSLEGYALVDYVAGKSSVEHEPVDKAMQGRLRAYVEGGGRLIVSGEEVGYALVEASTDPDDEAFLAEVLGAVYVADDANTYSLAAPATGPFAGITGAFLDDGSGGVYEVSYPDVLAPAPGASVALEYPDGTAAAVLTEQTLFVGAPIEAVVPRAARHELLARAVASLWPELEDEPDAGPLPGDDAGPLPTDDAGQAPDDDAGAVRGDAGDGRVNVASVKRVALPPPPPDCSCRTSQAGSASELFASCLLLLGVALVRRRRRSDG